MPRPQKSWPTGHRLTATPTARTLCSSPSIENAGAVVFPSQPRRAHGIFAGRVETSLTRWHPMSRKYGWRTAKNGASARRDTVGDAMTKERTCKICGEAVDDARIAQYPRAVSCSSECGSEYRRTQLNKRRKNYRHRRLASDPAFGLLEKRKARRRYVAGRLRLGKIVGPPTPRAGRAHVRGAIDTFLAAIRRSALGALRRAGMMFQG